MAIAHYLLDLNDDESPENTLPQLDSRDDHARLTLRRHAPTSGSPPAKRVTRTRSQPKRRGGHGARSRPGVHTRSIPTPA